MPTGYEDHGEADRFTGTQRWEFLKHFSPVHRGCVLGVVRIHEGEKIRTIGYLECKDKDEFEWLQRRIEGDRRIE